MTKSIEKQTMIIPGTYKGLWTAYCIQVIFGNGNKSSKFKVNNGARGINCDCVVTVDEDGWVYVE